MESILLNIQNEKLSGNKLPKLQFPCSGCLHFICYPTINYGEAKANQMARIIMYLMCLDSKYVKAKIGFKSTLNN